eukprot:SAG11_NODE_1845_length_4177_cov_2.602256_2_plen_155_part_00
MPGAVLSVAGTAVGFLLPITGFVELLRLHRARNTKMDGANTWWELTRVYGRGTLALLIVQVMILGLGDSVFTHVFVAIASFVDKEGAMETFMPDGFIKSWPFKYYFVILMPVLMSAVVLSKPWPLGARDPCSAINLSILQLTSTCELSQHLCFI